MKYDKNKMFLLLFVIVIIISSFGRDGEYTNYLKEEMQKKDSLINVLKIENTKLDSFITVNSDPILLAEALVKRPYIWELCKDAGRYFGTKVSIKKHTNPAINSVMYKALLELPDTMSFLATSAYRPYRGSQHRDSTAIDIRNNENGREFLKWIATCPGENWMQENDLDILIEYKYSSRVWNQFRKIPVLRAAFYRNRHATGDHIHLFIKRKKRYNL